MKKKILIISAIVIIAFVAVVLMCDYGVFSSKKTYQLDRNYAPLKVTKPFEVIDEYTAVASDGGLTLYVNPTNADFFVETSSGYQWKQIPDGAAKDKIAKGSSKTELQSALVVEYFDVERNYREKKNTQVASIKKNCFVVSLIENGFRCDYSIEGTGITIPLEVCLENGRLTATIIPSEVKEEMPDRFLLQSIWMLPNFGAASEKDTGYVLLPDGQGTLMYFNNGKYRFDDYIVPLYGENKALTKLFKNPDSYTANLPVYGARVNDNAYLAIITAGDGACTLNAYTNLRNSSFGGAYAKFTVRSEDSYLLDYESAKAQKISLWQDDTMELPLCRIEYIFLQGDEADYNGMAQAYRRYLIDEKGAKEHTVDFDVFVDYEMLVVRKTPFLGIPVKHASKLSDFDEIIHDVESLAAMGITPYITIDSWSSAQMSKKLDTNINIQRGIGGWDGWNKLNKYLKTIGGNASLAVNLIEATHQGNGMFTLSDAASALSGSPAYQYEYKYSTRMWDRNADRGVLLRADLVPWAATKMTDELTDRDVVALKAKGLGTVRYGSYGNELVTPEDSILYQAQTAEYLSEKYELTVTYPDIHTALNATIIADVPLGDSMYLVTDETVPFYQLVMSGLCTMTSEPINLCANPDDMLLYALATGVIPRYKLVTGDEQLVLNTDSNYLYSSASHTWVPQIIESIEQMMEVRKDLNGARMQKFYRPLENFTISTFDNGMVLYINYAYEDKNFEGLTIPARGYIWRKE